MAANDNLPPGVTQAECEGAGDGRQDERAEELDNAARCFVDRQLREKSSGWNEFRHDIRCEWVDRWEDIEPRHSLTEFREAVFELMKNHM